MVAVAVLAVISATVYHRNSESLKQQHSLEVQTIAQWVGQARLEEIKYRSRLESGNQVTNAGFANVWIGTYEFDLRTEIIPVQDYDAQWVVVNIYHINGLTPESPIQSVRAMVSTK